MSENKELQERSEMLEQLIGRAWRDEGFKSRLVQNPAGAVQEEFGFKVPDFIKVKVLEETADTRYIVLPYRAAANDELMDQELEAVAGGTALPGAGYKAGSI